MLQYYLQCWRVLFLFLSLTVCHLSGVRPYASLLAFVSSGPFVEVLPSSISRMESSILRGRKPRCLFLWLDFFYVAWFWVFFSFLLFYLFIYVHLFDGAYFQYSQVLISFLFSKRSDFSGFGSSISSFICSFPFLFISKARFSLLIPILISWLYILIACVRSRIFFRFLHTAWCRPCLLGGWFCISKFVHFVAMWFSGIIAITNSNRGSASPWKISHLIFTFAEVFPPAIKSTVQLFMASMMNFITLSDIFYILT